MGEAAGADPAADFRPFPELCTVTSSTYEWDSKCEDDDMSEHCRVKCFANWQYSFCVDTGPGSAVSACGYQSRTEEKLVCDSGCSRCNKAATPTFVPDQQTKCWKPAPGFNPIDTHYRCGNTPLCYKIFDPADDLKAATDENKKPLIVGVILLVIGPTAIVRTWDPPTQQPAPPIANRSADTVCRLALLPGCVISMGSCRSYVGSHCQKDRAPPQPRAPPAVVPPLPAGGGTPQAVGYQQAGGAQMMAQPMAGAPQAGSGQPAVQNMSVQVPQGMQGGMPLQVQTPAGVVQVQIPPGLQPGMSFLMQVPEVAQPAVASAVRVN